jgi:LysB family phage lysis regulatory protein
MIPFLQGIGIKLAIGALIVLAIGAGVFYVRELRAELADKTHQLDTARQAIADRDNVIRQLKDDAADKARQQQQLDTSTDRVVSKQSAIQRETRRIYDEKPQVRAWADTALPDDIVRLQSSPDYTGADDYSAAVPASDALHAAGDGTAH